MKKVLCIVLTLIMVFSATACGGGSAPSGESGGSGDEGIEIALMITNIGTVDDKSFNQGAWEGIKEYADSNGISYKYYQPSEDTTDAYLQTFDLAVKGGAKIIITPGYEFEPSVLEAQDLYQDTKIVILDGAPQDDDSGVRIEQNVESIFYAEEQSGFLAGYAAVKDGYRKLGFMGGMAVPAVVRFGYGFVQGAEYAAEELNLKPGEIEMNYTYVGNFDATPENQTLAATWYQGGTELIFACGGSMGNSVMAAAEQTNSKVVGVDVDQSAESDTVITSAMKNLNSSVYRSLEAFYNGKFTGGKSVILGAADDGIGLAIDTARFSAFTKAEYDAIYEKLKNDIDGLASGLYKDTDAETAAGIPVEIVTVKVF